MDDAYSILRIRWNTPQHYVQVHDRLVLYTIEPFILTGMRRPYYWYETPDGVSMGLASFPMIDQAAYAQHQVCRHTRYDIDSETFTFDPAGAKDVREKFIDIPSRELTPFDLLHPWRRYAYTHEKSRQFSVLMPRNLAEHVKKVINESS